VIAAFRDVLASLVTGKSGAEGEAAHG